MKNEFSGWHVVLVIRIFIVVICSLGIIGEFFLLFTYNVEHLSKSSFTLAFYFILVALGLLYDRTNVFKGEAVKITPKLFWALLVSYIFIELLIYGTLFGDHPTNHRIHRFAPMNIILSSCLFLFLLLSIFGQDHLGFVNGIRSNRKNN